MARIHARVKGKSGSTKPMTPDLSFVSLKAKEVEALIVKLVKEDNKSSSEIGIILRDTHAIPSVKAVCGKSIGTILKEHNLEKTIPEDLQALVEKVFSLKKHLSNNKKDTHNRRSLLLIESKIRRLTKYYKSKGRIAQNWRYD
ncbi:MAG: 30S ribosomal protein S15 [Nanoarchaeota archaeon]|nr:30S ribosomal protein S15 [Nanoarchaeota archaeon]